MYLCACVRNYTTEYIFRTQAHVRTHALNNEQSNSPTCASHATQIRGFDILVQILKYSIHSFHFVTLTIQVLLPSETLIAIHHPTWRSEEVKLNKHFGENCAIYMQRLIHANDRLGLSPQIIYISQSSLYVSIVKMC
jgi:hypothetical protein